MTQYQRALLFFHHILSSKKRAFIRDESRALGVSGICKVGYPGVLVVQGRRESVSQYVTKVKQLRWQSCTLNSSQALEEDQLADFGQRVQEIQELKTLSKTMSANKGDWHEWWTNAMGFPRR